MTIGYRVRPQFLGLWDPFQMAFLWPIWGVTKHLLTGMILQVGGDVVFFQKCITPSSGK